MFYIMYQFCLRAAQSPGYNCCVTIQGLHPSEEHLKANYITTPREGCPNLQGSSKCSQQMLLLFPLFEGCTATIIHGLTYAKILCEPQKRRKKERKWCGVDCHFRRPGQQKL